MCGICFRKSSDDAGHCKVENGLIVRDSSVSLTGASHVRSLNLAYPILMSVSAGKCDEAARRKHKLL